MPDLAVKLRADTGEFESDMGRARHVSEREMEGMIAKATAAGQLIGNAISKIAGHFSHMIGETLRAGDELSKLSQRTGQSVERLSELQFAAKLSDVSFSQLTSGIAFFNKALAEAQNENTKAGQTFRALGVDINAGPQAAMEQFMKSVAKLENPETKTAAMRIGFSRLGDALIPLIGNLDETTERARKLGIVMSEDLAKKSERFNDALITLQASGRAVAINALTPVAESLATISENLVKAKEHGEGWKGGLIEIAKVVVATAGEIGSMIPIIGNYNEAVAQAAFNRLQRMGEGPRGRGASGSWAEAGPPEPPNNAERVACAVAGGKWDPTTNSCVYKKEPKGRKPHDDSERIAREMARGQEEEDKQFSEAMGFLPDYERRMRERQYYENMFGEERIMGMSTEEVKVWHKAMLEAIDDGTQAEENAMRAAAGFTEEGKAVTENLKEQKSLAKDLGLTFTSAFEDAISGGKKFSDVLKGLANDLSKIFFRKTVTEPLGNAFSEFITKNVGGGGGITGLLGGLGKILSGGGAAAPDPVAPAAPDPVAPTPYTGWEGVEYASGTRYVPRTGLAMIHQGEAIIPASQNTGGARSGDFNVHIDATGADAAGLARVRAELAALGRIVQSGSANVNAIRRGYTGKYGRA